MKSSKASRIDDIEILRGVAILFVLAEHVRHNLFTWTSPALERFSTYFGGWTGVDLFFAISGFVIARGLIPRLDEGREEGRFFDIALSFWVRRAWRLLPSAWLWLAVILVAALLFNSSGAFGLFHTNFQTAVTALLNLADFRIAPLYGKEFPGASFHYWSLSLEEQFYLLLPPVVFLAGRRLPLALAALVLAQFFLDRVGPMETLFNIRSDALALGVLIALWARHPSHRLFDPTALGRGSVAKLVVPILLFAWIGGLGANGPTGFFDGQDHVVSFRVGMIALISAALVWIASYDRGYLTPSGWIGHAMLWLGSRSYALYLIHIPAFFATREIWYRIAPPGTIFEGNYTLRFALTGFGLLLLLAEINYRFVETPLRRKGIRIADALALRATAPALQPGGG
jgi:peptidoglycan/LPS O-acetylase OafA/YrhL